MWPTWGETEAEAYYGSDPWNGDFETTNAITNCKCNVLADRLAQAARTLSITTPFTIHAEPAFGDRA